MAYLNEARYKTEPKRIMSKHRPPLTITASTYPMGVHDTRPRFIRDLAHRLSSKFNVVVICPSERGTSQQDDSSGVRVIRFRYAPRFMEGLTKGRAIMDNLDANKYYYFLLPAFFLGQIIQTLRQAFKSNENIINAHWIIPQGACAILIKRIFRRKNRVVITCHGADIYALNTLNPIKKWAAKNCDHQILVSNAMKKYCDEKGILARHSSVIPMGVDFTNNFYSEKQERENDIIFVGRLTRKKGVATLVRALAQLKQRSSLTPSCTIVGDGPTKETLQILAQELGIKIRFTGALKHTAIAGQLRKHKVFVFPSEICHSGDREGLGLAPIEAMGCGCLAIGSTLETTKDFITHGETGLTFSPGDDLDLCNQLLFALTHTEEANKMAIKGGEYVREHFAWEKVAQAYSNLLSNLK